MKQKYILIVWAVVLAVGSAALQLKATDVPFLLKLWGALIAAAFLITSRFVVWRSPVQRNIQLSWLALVGIIFALNLLAFLAPPFSFLLGVSPYVLWTVGDGIGYFFTGRDIGWPRMSRWGLLSILTAPLFLIPALSPYYGLAFGIVQVGLLVIFILM